MASRVGLPYSELGKDLWSAGDARGLSFLLRAQLNAQHSPTQALEMALDQTIEAMRERHQHDGALALLSTLLVLKADRPQIYSNLGLMLRSGGSVGTAKEAFRRSLALDTRWAMAYQSKHE